MRLKVTVLLLLPAIFGWVGTAISASPPVRIISLSPAMTETLYSFGLGGRIVGVTNVCDRPADARKKPKVGAMSNPSLEAIVALKPDLVVMSRDGNPKELMERLARFKINTYLISANLPLVVISVL
jgi:iron complex transport system substrate-binding protein